MVRPLAPKTKDEEEAQRQNEGGVKTWRRHVSPATAAERAPGRAERERAPAGAGRG